MDIKKFPSIGLIPLLWPDIIQLSPKLTTGGTINELILIWQLAEPEDLANRISYLPL